MSNRYIKITSDGSEALISLSPLEECSLQQQLELAQQIHQLEQRQGLELPKLQMMMKFKLFGAEWKVTFGKARWVSRKKLPLRAVNFAVLVPRDYQAMLLDKIAALKRRKTNRIVIYILIGQEFGPLVLSSAMGALQQIFRKDRA
jgi:hypothetical protein